MKDNNWIPFSNFLLERTISPIKSPRFILYFLFIIIIVGSFGVFYEILPKAANVDPNFHWDSLIVNMANIFLAYIAASSVELILLNEDETKVVGIEIKDVQMLGVSFLVLGFVFWLLSIYFQNKNIGLFISGIGLLISYFVWWVSNSEKPQLNSRTNPLNAIGGNKNTSEEVAILKGDLEQFKTA